MKRKFYLIFDKKGKVFIMIGEKEIELINSMIYNAQLNGGDSGGAYYSNENGLIDSMNAFLEETRATEYVVKEKRINGDDILQFVNKKDILIF